MCTGYANLQSDHEVQLQETEHCSSCLDALLCEAEIGNLVQHPGIVCQYGITAAVYNGQPCLEAIVQEFMAGGDLFEALGYASLSLPRV